MRLVEFQCLPAEQASLPSGDRTGHTPRQINLADVREIREVSDGAFHLVGKIDCYIDLHHGNSLALVGEPEPGEVDKLGDVARRVIEAPAHLREAIATGDSNWRATR